MPPPLRPLPLLPVLGLPLPLAAVFAGLFELFELFELPPRPEREAPPRLLLRGEGRDSAGLFAVGSMMFVLSVIIVDCFVIYDYCDGSGK